MIACDTAPLLAAVSLRELMDRMGHASTRAALNYLHAREERDREIADGIEQMVRKVKGHDGRNGRRCLHGRVRKPLTCGKEWSG